MFAAMRKTLLRGFKKAFPRAYSRARKRYGTLKRRRRFNAQRRKLAPQLRQNYRERFAGEPAFRTAALYAQYYESEPLLENHVLYEASQGRVFGGNPYALLLHLLDNPDYKDLHHVIAVKDVDHPIAARFKDHPKVDIVPMDSSDYIRYCESCKYIVNDTSLSPYFIKREGQVYVYTWHSTLLKRLAGHTARPWEARNIAKSLLACDYFASPNRYTSEILLDAYYTDTLFQGTVTEIGYPRNDLLIHADKQRFRAHLGVDEGKKIILYAPTWRGAVAQPKNMIDEFLGYCDEIQSRIGDEYVVLAKMHNAVYRFLTEDDLSRVVPLTIDTNELLAVTDILISDYSGIMFDYLLTGNPLISFAFDLEEYLREQGEFYFPLEETPGPICRTVHEVVHAINTIDDVRAAYASRYEEFANRFVYADDGRACENLAALVFKGKAPQAGEVYRLPRTDKKRLLVFPSALAGNGVTESFLSLLNHVDYERYDISVLFPDSSQYLERHREVHHAAHLFYSAGTWGFTEEEYVQFEQFRRLGLEANDDDTVLREFFARNLRRVFAGCSFDTLVNYNGYSPVWSLALALGVDADRRVIYLHNDMNLDRETKNGFLQATFSTYRYYDSLFAVSKGSMKANRRNAAAYIRSQFGFNIERRIKYVMNLVEGSKVIERARSFATTAMSGRDYLVYPDNVSASSIRLVEKPQAGNVNFITVGRLSPEKRQDRLLKAFARVAPLHPEARLYVLGDGVRKSALASLAKALHIDDKVVFTGYVDNPYPLVDMCDCFVMSSDYEGLGLVVVESLILDTPVISTNIPGPRDVLRDGRGVLIRRSVAALTDAMCGFIENGMERVPFDYEAHNEQALRLFYEKVCLEPAEES